MPIFQIRKLRAKTMQEVSHATQQMCACSQDEPPTGPSPVPSSRPSPACPGPSLPQHTHMPSAVPPPEPRMPGFPMGICLPPSPTRCTRPTPPPSSKWLRLLQPCVVFPSICPVLTITSHPPLLPQSGVWAPPALHPGYHLGESQLVNLSCVSP